MVAPLLFSLQNALAQLFTDIHFNFTVRPDAEITVECNPGTIDAEKLNVMRDNGVNRLSFGLQAMQDETFKAVRQNPQR